jgi:hypothetical protein
VHESDGRHGALAVRVSLPDGEYDVDAAVVDGAVAAVAIRLRALAAEELLEDTPGAFVSLGRVRARTAGCARSSLPPRRPTAT